MESEKAGSVKANQSPQGPGHGGVFPLRLTGRRQLVVVGAVLLLYVFMAVSATTGKCVTFDEIFHLTSGYLYWTHPAYPMSPDNGIFGQAWEALPLVLDRALKFPPVVDAQGQQVGAWQLGHDFLYSMGNDPSAILLQTRAMVSLLGAALGALVFFWSRELFGMWGGLVSLVLFIFCPTMLANGALATTDMAAALGFFAATFGFWRVLHAVSWRNVLFSVAALGCLVITKMSSPLIVPIFFLILLVRFFSRRPMEIRLAMRAMVEGRWARLGIGGLLLVAHGIAAVAILWVAYDFKFQNLGTDAARLQVLYSPDFSLGSATGFKASVLENINEAGLLPPAYIEGLGFSLQFSEHRDAFLCGTFSTEGWWWFFPFAFLIKTPIASLLLFFFSFAALALWKWLPRAVPKPEAPRCPSLYDLSPLLILGGVYGLACLTSHLDIGLRHMMPVYPVLFVLAGANVFWLLGEKPVFKMVLAALLVGTMVESLLVWPNYLAFFNQLTGGPRNGYRYLVDSSLDWGQDLPGLRQWLEKNVSASSGTPVYLSYFGTGDPKFYGIDALLLPCFFDVHSPQIFPLHSGVYCLSATMLQGVYSHFPPPWTPANETLYGKVQAEINRWNSTANDPVARRHLLQEKGKGADYWTDCVKMNGDLRLARVCAYLRRRSPDDEVGYSILIYRLSDEDVRRALGGAPPE